MKLSCIKLCFLLNSIQFTFEHATWALKDSLLIRIKLLLDSLHRCKTLFGSSLTFCEHDNVWSVWASANTLILQRIHMCWHFFYFGRALIPPRDALRILAVCRVPTGVIESLSIDSTQRCKENPSGMQSSYRGYRELIEESFR